jgi:hypothetical protein
MKFRTRLQRLERLLLRQRPPGPERSSAERWLAILRLVESFVLEHAADRLDRHRQAIALLTAYTASVGVNAHIEDFCGRCLHGTAAWRQHPPHGGRLAFLEPNHLADLQEVQQIGQWQQAAVGPGHHGQGEPCGAAVENGAVPARAPGGAPGPIAEDRSGSGSKPSGA